jgi:hypothetical protein
VRKIESLEERSAAVGDRSDMCRRLSRSPAVIWPRSARLWSMPKGADVVRDLLNHPRRAIRSEPHGVFAEHLRIDTPGAGLRLRRRHLRQPVGDLEVCSGFCLVAEAQ